MKQSPLVYLAPMEGVVDHHMRHILAKIGGIDLCVTEFIRITGHTLPRRMFLRTAPELTPQGERFSDKNHEYGANIPTRVQLLGSDPQSIALNARKAAQLGAPAVDLNFGCPAKTVNKNRGGACLLDETDLIYDIVKTTRDLVPDETPVTVKIRLGYNERDSYIANAKAIEAAGASELVVHARSKQDGYNPPAYWSYIGEINRHLSIPVIANGEVWDLEDYLQCRDESKSQHVMIGRGLLSRPDLALAIKAHLNNTPYTYKSWNEIAELVLEFFELTSHHYAAKHMGNRVKQWLFYLCRNYPEAQVLFNEIKRSKDYTFIKEALILNTKKDLHQAS